MDYQYQLLPKLSQIEYETLKADIAQRGVLVPIEFDEKGNLLDGHHRLQICAELCIKDYPSVVRVGLSEDQKKEHVLALNLARRHLTPEQRREAVLRVKMETQWSNRRIAELFGVTHVTVMNDLAGGKNLPPAIPQTSIGKDGKAYPAKQKTVSNLDNRSLQKSLDALSKLDIEEIPDKPVASGEISKLAKRKEQERQREELVNAEQLPLGGNSKLIHSDIADLPFHITQPVDAIITDPPYPVEYLPVYGELARVAANILKPGAPLVVMVGHAHLPEILNLMAPHIQYLWTLAYITPANTARVFSAKALVNWKPVLVFSKGAYKGEWYADVVSNAAPDKRFHEWGQGESGMAALIERFSLPGDVILDPFCGASATGAAALRLGRRYIGADNDRGAINISNQRLAELDHEMA